MQSHVFANRSDALARTLLLGGGFSAAYLLLDRISFIHHLQELNLTPWNPQPALAIGLLALHGRNWLAWVFVTVLSAEFIVRELNVALASAILLTGILTLGYGGIAWLLRGPLGISLDLSSRMDVLRLAAAVAIGAGLTGALYICALAAGGHIAWNQYPHALFRFWIGDSIGIMVTLPLLLFLADTRRRRELSMLVKKPEVLLQVGAVVATLSFVFAWGEYEQFKYFYLVFLPLIWIAARHGLAGAVPAVAIIQVGIIVSVEVNDHTTLTVLQLQTRLLALMLTGLFLGVTVDEWRYASERLERARQLTAAGEMATALAHELNQPLTALTTYADAIRLLAGKPDGNAAMMDTADHIRRVATRCADIVGRFRGLEAGSARPLARIPIELPIRAALDSLANRAARIGAQIDVSIADDLPMLDIDRDRMTLVFHNLLATALDALADRPAGARHVGIAGRRDGRNHVAITVRDSGPGLRVEVIEKIFTPFYSGKAQGMGLGLAISRSIIESHGGRLWAESDRQGIFRMRLPL